MIAIAECEKGTKEKYELRRDADGSLSFNLDRMLKRKWIASYGCIPLTLQADGDELDCYILGKGIKRGQVYEVMPICMLYCADNGKVDNKLIVATPTATMVEYQIRRIIRFVERYKKGSVVLATTWKESNITYELAKCKAYRKLFIGGI